MWALEGHTQLIPSEVYLKTVLACGVGFVYSIGPKIGLLHFSQQVEDPILEGFLFLAGGCYCMSNYILWSAK